MNIINDAKDILKAAFIKGYADQLDQLSSAMIIGSTFGLAAFSFFAALCDFFAKQ